MPNTVKKTVAAALRSLADKLDPYNGSGLSAAGRAYNEAARKGYVSRLAGDIRQQGTQIAENAKSKVEFLDAWASFRERTVATIPKEFRPAAINIFEAERDAFWRRSGGNEAA
jgi:hypothetical protein